MARKLSRKRRNYMEARILAHDIVAVLDDADAGRFDYLTSIIRGEGFTQTTAMTDGELLDEYREGEYDGAVKAEMVCGSRAYTEFAYIRQLWDKGDMSGLHTNRGFFPVGSKEWRRAQ